MKPDGKAEPRFDIDLQYGRQGELQIADYLTWLSDGNGRIEVKRKRYLDLNFYVETHADKGRTGIYRPSGISVTTADAWAFVIAETGIALIVPTDDLRAVLDAPGTLDCEEKDGSCPTRGRLVNLGAILYRLKQRIGEQPAAKLKPTAAAPSSESATGEFTYRDISW
jgi:hypothetical protein